MVCGSACAGVRKPIETVTLESPLLSLRAPFTLRISSLALRTSPAWTLSGVMLAMQSAFAGAEVVDACLREPQRAAQALRRFDRLMRHVPRIYSWFICRVTNSVLRVIIMAPRNIFRVKETVLSVLAGDLFGRTRTDMRLLISKAFYYIGSALSPLRTLKAARMRSFNIRNVGSIDEPGAASH